MQIYAGTKEVAEWCQVEPGAVSNWLRRFTTYPLPDVQIGDDETRERVIYGWRFDRRQEWIDWAKHGERR